MFSICIETSCDETSIAICRLEDVVGHAYQNLYGKINSLEVVGALTHSQIKNHQQFGGVVPEYGARLHAEQIHSLFQILLDFVSQKTSLQPRDVLSQVEYIFVAGEVGLVSALRVGQEFAKSVRYFLQKQTQKQIELKVISHLIGHIFSCFYQIELKKDWQTGILESTTNVVEQFQDEEIFPHLHLLVSGGNTQIILLSSPTNWQIVGKTIDDAAGECFDKIGRMLGLPYPGGVLISQIAVLEEQNYFDFPVSMKHTDSFNLSYSGLKTAVRYFLQKPPIKGFVIEKPLKKAEILELLESPLENLNFKLKFIKQTCISAQTVIIKQLINQFGKAIKQFNPKSIGLSGGVSANLLLRNKILEFGISPTFITQLPLTGDNAVMIGLAGVVDKSFRLP